MKRAVKHRLIIFITLSLSLGATGLILLPACSRSPSTLLRNDRIEVVLDDRHGAIVKVANRLTGETWTVGSSEFEVIAEHQTIASDSMTVTSAQKTAKDATYELEGSGLRARLRYGLGGSWIEKSLSFVPSKPMRLKRVVMGSRSFLPAFRQIHAHSDSTLYNVPINWFLRSSTGGLYWGLEFPFSAMERRSERMALAYGGWEVDTSQPVSELPGDKPSKVRLADLQLQLKAGQEFVGEKEFIGVYRNAGSFCEKSIPGRPRIITTVPEKLDWGEVWAMQEFMRHVLPPIRHHDGFWLYLNGWWAGLPGRPTTDKDLPAYKEAVDRAKTLGASMFGPATFWLGMEQFFQRDSKFVRNVGKDLNFELSPPAKAVLDYVEKSGLAYMGSSEGKSHFREDRPDWKLVARNGSQSGELCWANPAAAEWFYQLHTKILSQYPAVKYWIWDGGWLPGHPGISLSWECYSSAHGHPPGNVAYLAYKNVLSVFERLRRDHPSVGLGVCWAVEAAGPWALRDLNLRENFYENPSPDDLRFQMWYQQNSRFIPCYKNMAQIWFNYVSPKNLPPELRDFWKIYYTETARDYRYGLMSALSGGVDLGFMVQFPTFKTEVEKRDYLNFLHKWHKWADANLSVLQVKRDLFGQPLRPDGIDGSAHVSGQRGFIFLFNPTTRRHIASVSLDNRIFLDPGSQFEIRMIGPDDGGSLGSYGYGESVLTDLLPGACQVLEIRPYSGSPIARVTPSGADIQQAF